MAAYRLSTGTHFFKKKVIFIFHFLFKFLLFKLFYFIYIDFVEF